MRLPRLLPLAVIVAIAPAATAARDVTIHRSHTAVRLATRAGIADVHLDPYRLDLRERRTMGLLTREQTPSGLFYERNGATHTVGSVSDASTSPRSSLTTNVFPSRILTCFVVMTRCSPGPGTPAGTASRDARRRG